MCDIDSLPGWSVTLTFQQPEYGRLTNWLATSRIVWYWATEVAGIGMEQAAAVSKHGQS